VLHSRPADASAVPDPPIHGASVLGRVHDEGTAHVNVLDEIVSDQLRTDLPELASGDTVRVSAKVVEGNRERIQVFEGTVMRLRGGGISRSITVRRIASGVGVERTFKVNSPRIDKIEVVRHGQVRRAQLYFLRKRIGKAATLRERRQTGEGRGRV
jgi:large subunit ribosomal protein L19